MKIKCSDPPANQGFSKSGQASASLEGGGGECVLRNVFKWWWFMFYTFNCFIYLNHNLGICFLTL